MIIEGLVVAGAVGVATYTLYRLTERRIDAETSQEMVEDAYVSVGPDEEAIEENTEEVMVMPDHIIEKGGLSDVKGIGMTRAAKLDKNGFITPGDLYFADDEKLTEIDGIGEYTVGQIREDIGYPDDGDAEDDE